MPPFSLKFEEVQISLFYHFTPQDLSCAPNAYHSNSAIEEVEFISVENPMAFWGYYSFKTPPKLEPLYKCMFAPESLLRFQGI